MNHHARTILLSAALLIPLAAPALAQTVFRGGPRIDIHLDISVGYQWIFQVQGNHTREIREARTISTTTHRHDMIWHIQVVRQIDRSTVALEARLASLALAARDADTAIDLSALNPDLQPPSRRTRNAPDPTRLDNALSQTTFHFNLTTAGNATLTAIDGPLPELLAERNNTALALDAPLATPALTRTFTSFFAAEGMLGDKVRLNSTRQTQRTSGAAPAGRLVWNENWRLGAVTSATALIKADLSAHIEETWQRDLEEFARVRDASGAVLSEWDTIADVLASRDDHRSVTIDWSIGHRRFTETRSSAQKIQRRLW